MSTSSFWYFVVNILFQEAIDFWPVYFCGLVYSCYDKWPCCITAILRTLHGFTVLQVLDFMIQFPASLFILKLLFLKIFEAC